MARAWRALAAAEWLAVRGLMLVAIAIIPFMAGAITIDVVLRYFLNAPTIWVFDTSSYAMLWLAFLAAPALIRRQEHIRIEFFTMRLRPRARAVAGGVTSLLAAIAMTIVFWQTANETYTAYIKNFLTVGSFEVPRWIVWVAMPIGSLFMVLEFVRIAWLDLVAARRGEGLEELLPPADLDHPVGVA